jgi:hypothetical protein
MIRHYVSWDLLDGDWDQVGGSDRMTQIHAKRLAGCRVLEHETEVEITPDGEFVRIVSKRTVYLEPMR